MNIYWDSEFTGLHQHTTLISIGFITENDLTFYAEFTDYAQDQVDEWLQKNILEKLKFGLDKDVGFTKSIYLPEVEIKGDSVLIKEWLLHWFERFDHIDLWSDCLSYDWVLLSELIADRSLGYPKFPEIFNYHSPYDILTLFEAKQVPVKERDREKFSGMIGEEHNALWDAKVIKACYEKLVEM
jgi:hypothetical protein